MKLLLPVFIAAFVLTAAAQDFSNTTILTADRTRLISGEGTPLFVQVRDANGNVIPNAQVSLSSSDPSVISVDSNNWAHALRLGTATIFANGPGKSAWLNMQVLPHHIEVRPARADMYIGDQLQFTATAFDINRIAVANTSFEWTVINAGGFQTRQASISSDGLLRALAIGPITVKATVRYFGINESELDSYTGIAQIVIKWKKEFRLSPLMATAPVQKTFHIRASPWTRMANNEGGAIAFVGSLDGLTSALLLYDRGTIRVLASAGVPGPLPGSFVWDFGFPGINKFGDVAVRADVRGNGAGILVVDRNGANFPIVEGQNVGNFARLGAFTTTRYSINDKGEVLFSAGYQDGDSMTWNTGLFKYTPTGIQAMTTTVDPLPVVGANYQIGYFGLDNNGVAYFSAYNGDVAGLYRTDGSGLPQKIAARGDRLAGSTITYLNSIAGFGLSADGSVAYGATLKDGTSAVVQYRFSQSLRVKQVSWVNQVYTISSSGDIFFSGGTSDGWGVYRWTGDRLAVTLSSGVTIDGAPVANFGDAFPMGPGDAYVQLSTPANNLVVAQASTGRVLFKEDTALNATANLSFLKLVPGSRSGSPRLLTGGNNPSIYALSANTLTADYIVGGDAGSVIDSWYMTNAIRSSSGELYTAGESTIFHHTNGHAETLLQLPLTGSSASLQWIPGWYESPSSMAVNSNGMIAFPAWAETHYVVCTLDRKRTTIVLQLGGSTPTASPSGGTFSNWLPYTWAILALDDDGRTMVGAEVRGGKSGLFLFENGQWRAAALLDVTQIDGDVIREVNALQGSGRSFFAQFNTDNGWIIAAYTNGTWKTLLRQGTVLPNGMAVSYMNGFDANRNGDLAFIAQANFGMAIGLRTNDGNSHVVHMTSDVTDAGDIFPYFGFSLNLLDDRKVYFTGIDLFDRNLLYLAEPLF